MSSTESNSYTSGAIYVKADEGTVKWVSGDEYNIKLTAGQSNGSLGFIVATVPPGNGPMAHIHTGTDEVFYMLDGELEILDGDRTFTASSGDFVFVPRGIRHRFKNVTSSDVKVAFMFMPGGQEQFFVDHGDNPIPGHRPELWTEEHLTPEIMDALDKLGIVSVPE